MKRRVILDTGPLVSLLNRADRHHRWTRDQWAQITPPLLTCEPVIAEACFLVRHLNGGQSAVIEFVRRGLLDVSFRLTEDTATIFRLLNKYQNVPMSLADACIVRLAEQYSAGVVFTLDSDFGIYRKHTRQAIPILMPPVHGA